MKGPSFWCQISLLFLVVFLNPSESNKGCEEKERSLAFLELAKDSITKAKELVPHCEEDLSKNASLHNKTTCGKREKLEAYIDIAMGLIDEAKEIYPNCDQKKPEKEKKEKNETLPVDCVEVQRRGFNKSGEYTIQLKSPDANNRTLGVYCDMETDGGGWTVIQRRGNFTPLEDFYREWKSYKNGFGSISRDFWIGNDNIFYLSNQNHTSIRFDLGDVDKNRRFALYQAFNIENEANNYKLHIGDYSGNAGDAMARHNGMPFSTKDKSNDNGGLKPCSKFGSSGWWFEDCYNCNPNGLYRPGLRGEPTSANWLRWDSYTGLAFIEIKIRA